MRTLKRNRQLIYYARSSGKVSQIYKDGHPTGEFYTEREPRNPLWANVSPARGTADTSEFGALEDYDKVIVLHRIGDITIDTVFWIDCIDCAATHDYIVKKIAISLNSVQIAVKKVILS